MDFRLNEEQTMLKDIVRKFVEKERLLELAREHDETEKYPWLLHFEKIRREIREMQERRWL